MFLGIKIVDVDTKYPNTNKLMLDFENRGVDGAKSGVHASKLSTWILLYFVVGKESNEVFRKNMRKFFNFEERMRIVGLDSSKGKDETTLTPFNVVYSMYMSVEKTCFDLGGAYKVKEFFVLNMQHVPLISHCEQQSEFKCGKDYCQDTCYYHKEVDNDEESGRNKFTLRLLLQIDKDEDLDGEYHVNDDGRTISVMRFDLSVDNKHLNVTH